MVFTKALTDPYTQEVFMYIKVNVYTRTDKPSPAKYKDTWNHLILSYIDTVFDDDDEDDYIDSKKFTANDVLTFTDELSAIKPKCDVKNIRIMVYRALEHLCHLGYLTCTVDERDIDMPYKNRKRKAKPPKANAKPIVHIGHCSALPITTSKYRAQAVEYRNKKLKSI